jgi:glutathionylspermidine synthase
MLHLTARELRDQHERPIDVLYKLYPTEHLMLDHTQDRVPVGRMVMGLVEAGRLAVINPPVAFLLQTKGLLALTWALHEAGAELLSAEEHRWIEEYMLPTYLEPADAKGRAIFGETPYIAKPVYGREGGSIVIHDRGTLIEVSPNMAYADQRYIYQQHVRLPRTTLLTEKGVRAVNLVFNCFVVGGRASAIGLRAGPTLILDDNAYFVPICYDTDSPA